MGDKYVAGGVFVLVRLQKRQLTGQVEPRFFLQFAQRRLLFALARQQPSGKNAELAGVGNLRIIIPPLQQHAAGIANQNNASIVMHMPSILAWDGQDSAALDGLPQ